MLKLGIKVFCGLSRFVYFFLKLFSTRNKICLFSRQGDKPSLDISLLQAELQKLLPDYEFVCKCKMVGNDVFAIVRYWPYMVTQMYHIATSKLVILDRYCIPISILKHKPELCVIQIWHAIGLMKKAGYTSAGFTEGRSGEIATLLNMHRGYTHILVSSPLCASAMLETFGYTGSIHAKGNAPIPKVIIGALPRVDYLQSEMAAAEVRLRFYERYPQLQEKKLILYAPTSRNDDTDLNREIEKLAAAVSLANEHGDDFALVVKFHPVRGGVQAKLPPQFIQSQRDNQATKDSNLLFDERFSSVEIGMIADACISDYSSIIFEFLAMEKPTYFFAFDLERYNVSRGFYVDYEKEIPGIIHRTAEDVISAILRVDYSPEHQREFLSKYVTLSDKSNTRHLAEAIAAGFDEKR